MPNGPDREGPPELRIADADREAVIDHLRRAVGEGRITLDEFSDRSGVVYAAKVMSELDAVLRDLPVPVAPAGAPTVVDYPEARVLSPPVPVPATRRRWIVAIMSGARRLGRWYMPSRLTAVAFWGGIDIDLREAVLEGTDIEITAWAVMGGIDIVVPEGIPVEMDGFVLMGGSDNRVPAAKTIPGAPVIRINARGMWGGVTVRTKSPRKSSHADRHVDRRAARGPIPPLPPRPPLRPPGARIDQAMDRARQAIDDAMDRARRRVGDDNDDDLDRLVAEVEREPPDLRRQAAPDGTATILFSDIEGSAQLVEQLGDRRWLAVLREHNSLVREQVARFGGTEVKAEGDGFMVVFQSARRAVLCAIGIQQTLALQRRQDPDLPLHVRIGLHTGEVIQEDGDFFGKHVILAARIAGEAKGGEIVASAVVRELTDGSDDLVFDEGREAQLRGLSRSYRLYKVDWRA